MIAYSSVNHMGYALLGMASLNVIGFNGAALQMINHGIITGALFLLVGVIYDRAHTRDVNAFGGLGSKLPVYTGIMTLACFASLGLPLLSGFVSEFLCFLGSFQVATLPLHHADFASGHPDHGGFLPHHDQESVPGRV